MKYVLSGILLLCLLVQGELCFPATYFSDDFESDASDYECSNIDAPPSQWDDSCGYCGNTVGFGNEFKMGAGAHGDNALYCWKSSTLATSGYRCYVEKVSGDIMGKKEIYVRWYQKTPTAENWDKECADGFKWWRLHFSDGGEFYWNHQGGSGSLFSTGYFVYGASGGVGYVNAGINSSDIQDNAWHCYEVHIKTATSGANGVVQVWLDGVQKYSSTSVAFDASSSATIDMFAFGIGNTTESEAFHQSSWTAVGFDDIVVADEYIGPLGASSTSSASGVVISGGTFYR